MQEIDHQYLELELISIYNAIERYEESITTPTKKKPFFKNPQSKIIIKRYFLLPLFLFSIFTTSVLIMGLPLIYIKSAFLILLLTWYVIIPTLQIMEIYADRDDLLQFFRNPNKIIIEGLYMTINSDCILANALKDKSIEALRLIKNRISVQQTAMVIRLGTLIGAIEKIGIIPGLITLYLAASSNHNELIPLIAAIVVFILYLFSFYIHFSLPRFTLYIKLIESEIENKSGNTSP